MRTRWWVCSTVSVGGPVGHVAIIRRSFFRWCLGNIQASLSLLGPKNWELASWDLCFCYFTLKVTHILKLPTFKNSGSKKIKTQDVNMYADLNSLRENVNTKRNPRSVFSFCWFLSYHLLLYTYTMVFLKLWFLTIDLRIPDAMRLCVISRNIRKFQFNYAWVK